MVEVQTQLGFLYGGGGQVETLTRTQMLRKVQVCQHVLDTMGKVQESTH
jgi:hypothetical protein